MDKYRDNSDSYEKVMWSIAFPGFGQILNGHYLKGVLFIISEFLINDKANLNDAIILSFYGRTAEAIGQTNFGWLMFYPCIYMFAIYDAYKNSQGTKRPFSFLPFVSSAYLGTIGVIYSRSVRIWGILPGPVLLPIACLVLGALAGRLISLALSHLEHDSK
jgi:hypothetical protein